MQQGDGVAEHFFAAEAKDGCCRGVAIPDDRHLRIKDEYRAAHAGKNHFLQMMGIEQRFFSFLAAR